MKGIRIMYVSNPQKCPLAVKILRQEVRQYNAMGFGYTFKTGDNGVEKLTIYLGSTSGFCVAIQMYQMKQITCELKQLLEDDKILKVGKLSSNQVMYLQKTYSISIKKTLDLRHLEPCLGNTKDQVKQMSQHFFDVLFASSKQRNETAARAALLSMAVFPIMSKMITYKSPELSFLGKAEVYVDKPYK